LNRSVHVPHLHWRDSSAAAAGCEAAELVCDVAVVAVDGAGVVPLEVELSPEAGGWLPSADAADMSALVLEDKGRFPKEDLVRALMEEKGLAGFRRECVDGMGLAGLLIV
jgi:hypothetical protein